MSRHMPTEDDKMRQPLLTGDHLDSSGLDSEGLSLSLSLLPLCKYLFKCYKPALTHFTNYYYLLFYMLLRALVLFTVFTFSKST